MRCQNYRHTFTVSCIVIAASIFSACSPRMYTYNGAVEIRKDLMIQLDQGRQQGVWKTNELSITYKYQMTPASLKLEGNTELVGGFAIGFSWIRRLTVYLLFLDKQGIVIESPLVYYAGDIRAVDMIPMDFEKNILVPEGACAISFAYDGELTGTGTEDITPYSIWHTPPRP